MTPEQQREASNLLMELILSFGQIPGLVEHQPSMPGDHLLTHTSKYDYSHLVSAVKSLLDADPTRHIYLYRGLDSITFQGETFLFPVVQAVMAPRGQAPPLFYKNKSDSTYLRHKDIGIEWTRVSDLVSKSYSNNYVKVNPLASLNDYFQGRVSALSVRFKMSFVGPF